METTIQNEMQGNFGEGTNVQPVNEVETSVEQLADSLQDTAIDPADLSNPNHPEHHKHTSALHAAGLGHSAVNRVMPRHRGIDL